MSAPEPPNSSAKKFAVRSRIAVLLIAYPLGAVALWAFLTDRVAIGIAAVVAVFILVMARGMWTAVRGMRAVSAQRAKAQGPTTPAASPDNPSPIDRVVTDLVSMNADGLPYRIDATRTSDGVQVDVRWKSEELRWNTLFTRGDVTYAWRMEITLDPTRAQYRFTEYSGSAHASAVVGPGMAHAERAWTWKKGKTAYQTSASFREGADGEIVVDGDFGPRTSWEGATVIRPSDAKKPVFAVLRGHGWRPRRDWFGARAFEK